jgi:phosphoribosylanthranilate isomerase
MINIKICGLFREADIDFANEAGPDFAGFVFAESRRQVSPAQAARLRSRLRDGIVPVGVFVNAPAEEIAACYRDGLIGIAQLHGDEDAAYIRRLKTLSAAGGQAPVPVIKALRIGGAETPAGDDHALCAAADSLRRVHTQEPACGEPSVRGEPWGGTKGLDPKSNILREQHTPSACLPREAGSWVVDYLLLDSGAGSGKPFDWDLLLTQKEFCGGGDDGLRAAIEFGATKLHDPGNKVGSQGAPGKAREPVSVFSGIGNTAPPSMNVKVPDWDLLLTQQVDLGDRTGAQGAPDKAGETLSLSSVPATRRPPNNGNNTHLGGSGKAGGFGAQGAPDKAREPVSVFSGIDNTAPPSMNVKVPDWGVAEDLPSGKAGAKGGPELTLPAVKKSTESGPPSFFSIRWFLAGGIDCDNIEKALSLRPFGIDVSSGAETDGVKDRKKMIELVKRVKQFQNRLF